MLRKIVEAFLKDYNINLLTMQPLSQIKNPNWGEENRVHNWKNYIPEKLKPMWETLPQSAQLIAFLMAEIQADKEEWE